MGTILGFDREDGKMVWVRWDGNGPRSKFCCAVADLEPAHEPEYVI